MAPIAAVDSHPMAETLPPRSLPIERGRLYYGTECKHCERPIAISEAPGANVPFPHKPGLTLRIVCRGCSSEGEYQAQKIRSFVG